MRRIDVLGYEPKLFIYGSSKYRTNCGALLSIVYIFLVFGVLGYFFYDLFSRNKVYLLTNTNTRYEKVLNLSASRIMIRLSSVLGEVYNSSVAFPIVSKWDYSVKNNGKPIITVYSYEKCDLDKHFGTDREKFTSVPQLETYYCLNMTKDNDFLFHGTEGDFQSGFSKFVIYAARCTNESLYNPSTVKNYCASPSYISRTLTSTSPLLILNMMDYEIDNMNISHPISSYLNSISFFMTYGSMFKHNYYLKKLFYTSDDGYLTESLTEYNAYQYDKTESSMIIGTPFAFNEAFGALSFYLSPKADFHLRFYIKLQTVIANVGGFINAFLIITNLIFKHLSQKFLLRDFSNQFFTFEESLLMSPHKSNKSPNKITQNSILEASVPTLNNFVKGNKKKERLITWKDVWIPRCFHNEDRTTFEKCVQVIKKKLSFENLFLHMNQFENLKTLILDEVQKGIINTMNKRSLEDEFNYFKGCMSASNVESKKNYIGTASQMSQSKAKEANIPRKVNDAFFKESAN